jgi:hypothetical protein
MPAFNFSKCGNHASVDSAVMRHLRDIGASDALVRSIGHTGWFTDFEFADATYRGNVWQLPSRKGRTLFLAGYIESVDSGYVVLDAMRGKLRLFDTAEDAARAGDELARVNAERECEYQSYWHAEMAAEEALADARDAFKDARDAWREQQGIGALGARLCKDLRQRLTDARDAFKAALASLIDARADMARYQRSMGY